ncbi:MAG: AI-2E family transporter [Oscillospiraceae bacterium]|nr:AI-2E family transporter [Oscillospiraceae bacterium]
MESRTKQNLILVIIGVTLFVALEHLNVIWAAAAHFGSLLLPVFMGAILALFLSVPMNGIERGLRRAMHRDSGRLTQTLSLLVTILAIVCVLVLVVTIVIPAVSASVTSAFALAQVKVPQYLALLEQYGYSTEWISGEFNTLAQQTLDALRGNAGNIAGTIASVLGKVGSGIIGIVISLYLLMNKDKLARHAAMVAHAYLRGDWADRLCAFAARFHRTFAKFLTGQSIEAVILGALMFVAFLIVRLPYAGLIAILTAVCSFIPYIGAFLACGTGTLLTLMESPVQALVCLCTFLLVQFIEGQFIYPRVVGSSVGLSPLLTLLAALIGGKLFGLLGLITFIPIGAVLYGAFRDCTLQRLREKKRQ